MDSFANTQSFDGMKSSEVLDASTPDSGCETSPPCAPSTRPKQSQLSHNLTSHFSDHATQEKSSSVLNIGGEQYGILTNAEIYASGFTEEPASFDSGYLGQYNGPYSYSYAYALSPANYSFYQNQTNTSFVCSPNGELHTGAAPSYAEVQQLYSNPNNAYFSLRPPALTGSSNANDYTPHWTQYSLPLDSQTAMFSNYPRYASLAPTLNHHSSVEYAFVSPTSPANQESSPSEVGNFVAQTQSSETALNLASFTDIRNESTDAMPASHSRDSDFVESNNALTLAPSPRSFSVPCHRVVPQPHLPSVPSRRHSLQTQGNFPSQRGSYFASQVSNKGNLEDRSSPRSSLSFNSARRHSDPINRFGGPSTSPRCVNNKEDHIHGTNTESLTRDGRKFDRLSNDLAGKISKFHNKIFLKDYNCYQRLDLPHDCMGKPTLLTTVPGAPRYTLPLFVFPDSELCC